MASGEARTTWQHMANRCFFPDDTVKVPKLACSSLSRPHHSISGDNAEQTGQVPLNYVHLTGGEVSCDVLSGTKWWLQFELEPTNLKDSLNERDSEKEAAEALTNRTLDHSPQSNSDSLLVSSYDFAVDGSVDSTVLPPQMVSTSFLSKDSNTKVEEELKSLKSDFQRPVKCKANVDEYWCENGLKNCDTVEKLMSKKLLEDYFELEQNWKGGKNIEPWWKIADEDDLSVLIAGRSQCQVENRDLSQFTMDSFVCVEEFNQNKTSSINVEQNEHSFVHNQEYFMQKNSSIDRKYQGPDEVDLSKDLKCCSDTNAAAAYNQQQTKDTSEVDSNKSQLLQALCQSQTRARKAEIAAQKAYSEKQHIVKLLFRQASHLFAYKQWLQMLQLESLFLQMKIRENQISSILPELPWMPFRWPELSSVSHNDIPEKGNKNKKKCSTCRYIFAFAVGFSVASASLILGLTLGWLPLLL